MYRIHFNYKTGNFVVQVLVLGLFWMTVRRKYETGDLYDENTEFSNYGVACQWVEIIGLNRLYTNKSANTRPHLTHVGERA